MSVKLLVKWCYDFKVLVATEGFHKDIFHVAVTWEANTQEPQHVLLLCDSWSLCLWTHTHLGRVCCQETVDRGGDLCIITIRPDTKGSVRFLGDSETDWLIQSKIAVLLTPVRQTVPNQILRMVTANKASIKNHYRCARNRNNNLDNNLAIEMWGLSVCVHVHFMQNSNTS